MPQYPIESVDNALKVVLLLAERGELRLTDVSDYLGVASSSAHRMLAMLLYRGFVQQDPKTKIYTAGTALTKIAFSITRRLDFLAPLHRIWRSSAPRSMRRCICPCSTTRRSVSWTRSKARRWHGPLHGWVWRCPRVRPRPERRCSPGCRSLKSRSSIRQKNSSLSPTAASRPKPDCCESSRRSGGAVMRAALRRARRMSRRLRSRFPLATGCRTAFSTAIPRPRMSPTGKRRIGEIVMGVVDDAAQLLKT